jgi:hypothetical protein
MHILNVAPSHVVQCSLDFPEEAITRADEIREEGTSSYSVSEFRLMSC